MRDKKKDTDDKTDERKALERHVDAMMDPKLPDQPAKTAPQLSDRLKKQMGVSDEAKPISIKKLDELTQEIAGSKPAEKPEAPDTDEPSSKTDIPDQGADLDDARTDEAVDDIVSHEGDVMLAVTDATAAERNRQLEESYAKKEGKGFFGAFLWFLVFVICVIAIVLAVLFITGGNVSGMK